MPILVSILGALYVIEVFFWFNHRFWFFIYSTNMALASSYQNSFFLATIITLWNLKSTRKTEILIVPYVYWTFSVQIQSQVWSMSQWSCMNSCLNKFQSWRLLVIITFINNVLESGLMLNFNVPHAGNRFQRSDSLIFTFRIFY